MKKNKLLLIGWDVVDWDVIWLFIVQGKMFVLKKIIENGVYGNMSIMSFFYLFMLWILVVIGKILDKYGILGFIEVMLDVKMVRLVIIILRKIRVLWNIFYNKGLKSNLVGWWLSFLVEFINGYVILDCY